MHSLSRSFSRFARLAVIAGAALAFIAAPIQFAKPAPRGGAIWQTDYEQALAQAGKEKKNVLLDFTGSDWCPYCIQMDKEVLSRPEFEKFAQNHLVLVKLDFPRRKQLPPVESEQNHRLGRRFAIEGYPTYILVDPNGKEVRRQVGYLGGGPKEFIKWAHLGS
jgi:protein disulfide-isomerase